MPESDPLTILLAHSQWATRQILEASQKLTSDQFHQRFEMGPGSLHDTTTHIVGSMKLLTQVLAGQTPGPRLEQDGQRRSPQELIALLDSISIDFASEARACRSIKWSRGRVMGRRSNSPAARF